MGEDNGNEENDIASLYDYTIFQLSVQYHINNKGRDIEYVIKQKILNIIIIDCV